MRRLYTAVALILLGLFGLKTIHTPKVYFSVLPPAIAEILPPGTTRIGFLFGSMLPTLDLQH